jgi:protein subunit release factor B
LVNLGRRLSARLWSRLTLASARMSLEVQLMQRSLLKALEHDAKIAIFQDAANPEISVKVTPEIVIDQSELAFSFARAGGPGGQNVNKAKTAVQLRFDVARAYGATRK